MNIKMMGVIMFALTLLISPVASAQMKSGGMMEGGQMGMMMRENEEMMDIMHMMMDRFKEMEQDEEGSREMNEMMQRMGQMMVNRRMEMMMEENAEVMQLMHEVMGHLKGMEKDEAGRREMEKMRQRMSQMMMEHRAMMERMGMMQKGN
jgi:ribosomal protein S15P/S13E